MACHGAFGKARLLEHFDVAVASPWHRGLSAGRVRRTVRPYLDRGRTTRVPAVDAAAAAAAARTRFRRPTASRVLTRTGSAIFTALPSGPSLVERSLPARVDQPSLADRTSVG
jgi:hypothetical protein